MTFRYQDCPQFCAEVLAALLRPASRERNVQWPQCWNQPQKGGTQGWPKSCVINWRFAKIGVLPNHPFSWDFPLTIQLRGSPINWNPPTNLTIKGMIFGNNSWPLDLLKNLGHLAWAYYRSSWYLRYPKIAVNGWLFPQKYGFEWFWQILDDFEGSGSPCMSSLFHNMKQWYTSI